MASDICSKRLAANIFSPGNLGMTD